MNKMLFTAAALGLFASAATIPQPAMAQGSVAKMSLNGGYCPRGYVKSRRGPDTTFYCYPDKGAKPAYPKEGSTRCATGYEAENSFCVAKDAGSSSSSSSSGSSYSPTVEARLGKGGRLAKPSKGNRCPTGWASTEQLTECFTMIDDAPTARPKGNKPCAAGELNDFDLWCTSNYTATTARQAYSAMTVDFNRLYTSGFQNMQPELSADATAHFGPDTSTVSSDSSSGGSQSAEQTAQAAQCTTGSASGAAVGGALAGEAGAALGSMLGGLGKKKKKKEGC